MNNKRHLKWIISITAVVVVVVTVVLAVITLPDSSVKSPQTVPIPGGEIVGEMGIADSFFDDNDDALAPSYIVNTQSPTTSSTSSVKNDSSTTTSNSDSTVSTPTSSTNSNTPEEPDIQPNTEMTYEEFQQLTPAQMRAFEESFESKEAFFEWYNAAKAKYEAENPTITPDENGVVDLEKYN